MPKIYRGTAYDNAFAYYFFATKKEAKAHQKEWLTGGYGTYKIEEMLVETTKRGIVAELNWFVTMTCLNEH